MTFSHKELCPQGQGKPRETTMHYLLNKYGAFLFRSIKKLYQKTERLNNVDALILTMQVQRAFDILFSLT